MYYRLRDGHGATLQLASYKHLRYHRAIVHKFKYVIAMGVLAFSPRVGAVDGMSLEIGKSHSSNADVKLYRMGLQWDWGKQWFDTGNWHLGGYWDLNLGYWDNRSPLKTNDGLQDLGFAQVFRFQKNKHSGFSPYVELGLGLHLLSKTSVGLERKFGSAVQFGSHLGVGLRFGDKGRYDLSYRYQHLSNAGIKAPNQGINYHLLRMQYHF